MGSYALPLELELESVLELGLGLGSGKKIAWPSPAASSAGPSLASNFASSLPSTFAVNFTSGSTTLITLSFAIFVVLLQPDRHGNWFQTATAMRDKTCCCNSRIDGTLPPTRP